MTVDSNPVLTGLRPLSTGSTRPGESTPTSSSTTARPGGPAAGWSNPAPTRGRTRSGSASSSRPAAASSARSTFSGTAPWRSVRPSSARPSSARIPPLRWRSRSPTRATRPADVVQLYLHEPVASVVRPVNRLIGYHQVELEPGGSTRITFTVHADPHGRPDSRAGGVGVRGTPALTGLLLADFTPRSRAGADSALICS